jgi:hypothetical protein
MKPLAGNKPLVDAIQKHGEACSAEPIPAMGTPLYTDVRLYGEAGIPGVIYGAGPRTVLESHAKRADERWSWKTCAAPPRWSRARCATCWHDSPRMKLRSILTWRTYSLRSEASDE